MFDFFVNAVKELFFNYGGWLVLIYAASRLAIWIVRKTKTQTDDNVLDTIVVNAVSFASSVIPQNAQLNWLKFTANALGKFTEAYTKSQGDAPDATTYEKAKKLIEEIATQKETAGLKNSNG